MADKVIGLMFLAVFIAVAATHARRRAYFDRYYDSLDEMPIWWMRQQGYGRRRT
jgi:hypothetical protein